MSAEIDMSNNRINFAKRIDVPVWWERGNMEMNIIEPGDDIIVIAEKAGIDFPVSTTQTFYTVDRNGEVVATPSKGHSIIRLDTGAELGYGVTKGYRVHQPIEIAKTMERICQMAGMEILTAGSLRGGGTIWIQAAHSDMEFKIGGETVKAYLVLSGDNTGSAATRGHMTNVVVVCANTFRCMEHESRGDTVTLSHRGEFDEDTLMEKLGFLGETQDHTIEVLNTLREQPLAGDDLIQFILGTARQDRGVAAPLASTETHALGILNGNVTDFREVGHIKDEKAAKEAKSVGKVVHSLLHAYRNSPGQKERGATKWAGFNMVTYYADHMKSSKGGAEGRLIATQEGSAAKLKARALEVLAA